MGYQNPEDLHDVGQDKKSKVDAGFVNPGTAKDPLVSREQLSSATVKGNGAEVLKANLIK